MGLALHPNELLFLFDGASASAKRTLAFAQTVSNHVHEMDYNHSPLTKTSWQELLNLLQMDPKELLNKAHPEYQEKIQGHDFSMDDWLDILVHNPHLLKAPIAVKDDRAILCERPKDVLKLSDKHTNLV